ncbi:phospholipase A2 [Roseateles sp.]|uniref:phospholipase A2 n=1 Tax=Roseateles sp. TaxID=1971397 RepID=UPI0039E997D0
MAFRADAPGAAKSFGFDAFCVSPIFVAGGNEGDPICTEPEPEPRDYCTGVPDSPLGYDFASACMAHDENYSRDTTMTREEADLQFRADLHAICEANYNDSAVCHALAEIYYMGVSLFGWLFYEGNPNHPPYDPANGIP